MWSAQVNTRASHAQHQCKEFMVGAMLVPSEEHVGFEGNQLLCKRRSQIARSFMLAPCNSRSGLIFRTFKRFP
jgi:hypothetical protein